MSGVNIPTDSTHLSDQAVADMIEQYGGVVDSQFNKKSMMRNFVDVKTVKGTDTIMNRRVGRTALTTLTAGVRPAAAKTSFGSTSLTIDTVVMARDNRSMLNEFQIDFNARAELGKDHGKELGKLFDESLLIAGIKGAAASAPAGLNGAFGAGTTALLGSAGDELDPTAFYTALETGVVAMQSADMDTEECVWFVTPTQYAVLLNNDKLVNQDYSTDNGDFANGKFKTVMGVPIVATNRLPTAAITGHALSTTANGDFYDVTAAEARTEALLLHPSALMVGETIPLTSDVYFSKIERQWFIDSLMAYGANFNRPDGAYAVQSIL
ncbi:MAG: hypothetical protein P8P29_01430 [Flavobacteriaceae bacterium]|nr:hypothetical protein [Flavobacteriaceae bacterium]